MCGFLKKWTNKNSSSAKVVDGSLILSLPDAINPVVWRMELGNVKASALEVLTVNDNVFQLSLKTAKGEVHEIAPFDTRDKAVQALMNVSSALQNAHGKMTPVSSTTTQTAPVHQTAEGSSSVWKWLLSIVGILFAIYILSLLFVGAPSTPSSSAAGAVESGIPMSADQYLRGF
jgi:hypothetical protein